jgi:hypothetical protein
LHDEKFERMSKSMLRIKSSIFQRPLRDNTGMRAARKKTEREMENNGLVCTQKGKRI